MTNVIELTPNYGHIEQDTTLIFPNVLTCMAFIAHDAGNNNLIGVHFTTLDQSQERIAEVWDRVQYRSFGGYGAHDVYLAGPGTHWNATLLVYMKHPAPATFRTAVTPAGVDIRATLLGDAVHVSHSPAFVGAPWVPVAML